jgi:large subunit ribosomal protein L23
VSTLHDIIRHPLVTEKNTVQRESGKYVFEVRRDATKPQIREAVQKIFGVKVVSVNTIVVKGKYKRTGRFAGYRSDRKKAIVRLAAGQTIAKFGEV